MLEALGYSLDRSLLGVKHAQLSRDSNMLLYCCSSEVVSVVKSLQGWCALVVLAVLFAEREKESRERKRATQRKGEIPSCMCQSSTGCTS